MKSNEPRNGSGKTFFNRGKPQGTSWTVLRSAAIKAGTWRELKEKVK